MRSALLALAFRRAARLGLAGSLLLLGACSTPARIPLPDGDQVDAGHAALKALAKLPPARTLIRPGDTVRVVRDADTAPPSDTLTLYPVQPDGSFAVPNAGVVEAAGHTPEEVAREITARFAHIYRQPAVTVNIVTTPGNKVFIGGAVARPGAFDLPGTTNLTQLLLASGGVLPSADSANVALLRADETGSYHRYFFDLADLLRDPDRPAVALQRGDILFVPQSGLGSAVEAMDMYVTRLIPIQKSIGLGFNYNLNSSDTTVKLNQ